MSKVKRPRIKAPEREPDPAPPAIREEPVGPFAPGDPVREKVAHYTFGTLVCGAAMVAAAAWMGGSMGMFGRSMQAGIDKIASGVGFSIDKIAVLGPDALLEPTIEAKVREAAGVVEGDNMFSADPERIRKRVESLDAVAGVSVYRFWPDQVTIIAESRMPMALWRDGEVWRVIDHSGRTFAEAKPTDFMHLPRVEGAGGDVAAAAFLDLIDDYPALDKRVETAVRVGGRRWDVLFDGGVSVSLPEDESMDKALGALNLLEARSRVLDMPVQLIDARHPERFAVRPVAAPPTDGLAQGA